LRAVDKVYFDHELRSWMPQKYELPHINGDYVILTPKDMLTKDDSWINRSDLIDNFQDIATAVPDDVLRAQLNDYLLRMRPPGGDFTREEWRDAVTCTIEQYPKILDYYIKDKEEHAGEAKEHSRNRVRLVEDWFIHEVRQFVAERLEPLGFYQIGKDTYAEAKLLRLTVLPLVSTAARPSRLQLETQLSHWPHFERREENGGAGP
jgi:hypothetical protein